jgi:hypothetical protein
MRTCSQLAYLVKQRSNKINKKYIMAFLLHFKDNGTKKNGWFFFVLSFTRSIVLYSPTFLSHLHKLQSVSFQKMHILASGPELQAVRFGYVILGEN